MQSNQDDKRSSNQSNSSEEEDAKILNMHPHEINEKMTNRAKIFTSLGAGAMAGAVAKSVIAPLDRTKIYFQTNPNKNYRFKGAVKFLRKTYTENGVLALWRGNSATMARIIPYAAVQFMAHEQYKTLLGINQLKPKREPTWKNFIAGSLAGLTGQSLTYPLDRARAVLAITKPGDYSNLKITFRRLVAEEGLLSLYRGYSPTVYGVIIYAGVSFFTYESLKHSFADENANLTPTDRLAAGALAGLIGQASSYPLDIVRRRMQTASQLGYTQQYDTIVRSMANIYRNEGFKKGLFKLLSHQTKITF